MKAKKPRDLFWALLLALAPAFLLAGEISLSRVEVIMPSYPIVDAYAPITIVARTEAWAVDRNFTGDAWLWPDSAYLKPFHVRFVAADQGVIRTPAMLNLVGVHRVEAYLPGGSIQSWSNPVLATGPDYPGPRLFWGKLGEGKELGLDFCIGTDEQPPPASPEPGPPSAEKALLPALKKELEGQTWYLVLDPEDQLRSTLANKIKAANSSDELFKLVNAERARLAVIYLATSGASNPIRRGLLQAAKPAPPPCIAVLPGPAGGEDRGLENSADAIPPEALAVIPGPDALFGVWATGNTPGEIWHGLQAGTVYGARSSRIIIDWSGQSAQFLAGPGQPPAVFIAGCGPREEITVYKWQDGKISKIKSLATDDFHLNIPFRDLGLSSGAYFLEVTEPGSPRRGRALAGPIPLKP